MTHSAKYVQTDHSMRVDEGRVLLWLWLSALSGLSAGVMPTHACPPDLFSPISQNSGSVEKGILQNPEFMMVHTGLKPVGVLHGELARSLSTYLVDQGDLGVSLLPHLRWFRHDGNLVLVNFKRVREFFEIPQYKFAMMRSAPDKAKLLNSSPEGVKQWVWIQFNRASKGDTLDASYAKEALSGILETPPSDYVRPDHPSSGRPSLLQIFSNLDLRLANGLSTRDLLNNPNLLLQ